MDFPNYYSKGPTPCSQVEDPDTFFPDPEVPGSITMTNEAKKICADCPYIQECLAWAVDNDEIGIWGGTTKNQRRKIKQDRGKSPIVETKERSAPRSGGYRPLKSDRPTVTLYT